MMNERRKFWVLLLLLIVSVALVLFVRNNFGQGFVQNL